MNEDSTKHRCRLFQSPAHFTHAQERICRDEWDPCSLHFCDRHGYLTDGWFPELTRSIAAQTESRRE